MGGTTAATSKEGHLQARLSRLTMVAMTFAILNTWICLAGSMGLVIPSGGSVAFLYGFIFCVLCNFAVVSSLGELAAIWPTAGGQYHFVYALCTDRWKNMMSFLVGWINIAGWLTLVTTEGFFAAQFVSAASVIASNGRYEAEAWKTYLFFVVILTFATVSNIWGNRILGRWNDAALYWSIFSVIIISIVLLSMSPKTNAAYVFTNFHNETGWSSGMAWMLGLLQSALSLIGFDAVLHMTEEMPHPARDAPRAMIYAIAIGGITGTVFIIVILFCLANPSTVMSTSTGMPISELIFQATRSRAGATVITLMLAICFINGTNGCTTSASRLIFSMARDKGFILLFGLLYLGPTVAFNAYIASCTIFLNLSYAFPIFLLIIRGRKVLARFQTAETPFKLGDRWGIIVNLIAATYVAITTVFFCFPPGLPVSANFMNYVPAVIGIFAVLVVACWWIYRNTFEGPVSLFYLPFAGFCHMKSKF
ncbi:amino acid permease-domain-containing protein [Ilyonectria robusta]|uniref:amino acid permease-domain-containing protein n=1 Tax=Ilyonectria robusta TaxID=1079257 RepID=UPI001E8EE1F5|nr:amino acid permease-domain-containing protein [Ilyonectria robusta]KAH8735204.1 amino acid permease-domain-containing protein [Ilyonectria robusta]